MFNQYKSTKVVIIQYFQNVIFIWCYIWYNMAKILAFEVKFLT